MQLRGNQMTTTPAIMMQYPAEPENTLFDVLLTRYYAKLQDNPNISEEERERSVATLAAFEEFANEYLTVNRPVGLRMVSSNYVIMMDNSDEFLVCAPERNIRGTMNPIMGVPINPSPSADFANVAANQGAVMVTGATAQRPQVIDYRHAKATGYVVDKRLTTKPAPLNSDVFNR